MTKPFIDHSALAKCSAAVVTNSNGEKTGSILMVHSPGSHKARLHIHGNKVTPPIKRFYPTDAIADAIAEQGFKALDYNKRVLVNSHDHDTGHFIGSPGNVHYLKKGNCIYRVLWAIT